MLLLGSIAAAAMAKTGIVTIPFFSHVFYAPPQPKRVVTVDPDVGARLRQGVAVAIAGNIGTITLTEVELTYLLREMLATGAEPTFSPTVQAVVGMDSIELTGLLLKPIRVNVTIALAPGIGDGGRLNFRLKTVTIGALSVPPSLARQFVDPTLQLGLELLSSQLAEFGTLESVSLKDGAITLTGAIVQP